MRLFLTGLILSLFACKVYGSDISPSKMTEIPENYSICFFTEKFLFSFPKKLEASPVHGRFLISSEHSDGYDLNLLKECADLNYSAKKKTGKFVKKLKETFSKKGADKKKLEATLGHFHCVHAISSCDFDDLGEGFMKKLFIECTEAAKKLSNHFSFFENYSFLTVELSNILFSERNIVTRPFGLDRLIETVSAEVMVHLLEMWNYDLRFIDIHTVLNVWASNEQFKDLIDRDPRSWLLWKKIGAFKPFPMDLLISKLSLETVVKHINLILAWVLESERIVAGSLYHLEFLHANFHKDDLIEGTSMTPEMVEALDSRKWDLWYEAGKADIVAISDQMKLKQRLIEKLKAVEEENAACGPLMANEQLAAHELTILLQIPLKPLARESFNLSRDINNVVSSMSKVYYSAEVMRNLDYWTVLWKQLEIFEIELAYEDEVSLNFADGELIINFILAQQQRVKHFTKGGFFWYSQLILFVFKPIVADLDSEFVVRTLLELAKSDICELSMYQFNYLRSILHPEAIENHMKYLKMSDDPTLVNFKFAPQLLEDEDITYLLNDPILKEMMKIKTENVTKLRSMSMFAVADLKYFFSIGDSVHLENCEAFYTLKPQVLATFLRESEGGLINFPSKLIWQVGLECWHEPSFADAVADLIPFDTLVHHPEDSEVLNLHYIMTDIVGRLNRRAPSHSAQKMILKWIVHMEWIFFQYFNYLSLEKGCRYPISEKYEKIVTAEKRARAELITWLNSNTDFEDHDDILRLVTRIPVNHARVHYIYEHALFESIPGTKIRLTAPKFEIFHEKPMYQVRSNDLDIAARDAISNCESLIKKYFGIVEVQIWSNRLEFINISTSKKYLINPVRTSRAKKIFYDHTSPYEDLKIFGLMLLRCGYWYCPGSDNSGEFLVPNNAVLRSCERRAEEEEKSHAKGHAFLIEAEIIKRIAGKKIKK